MRMFQSQSSLLLGSLALALAPALTPAGLDPHPDFFSGLAVHPQVLARGLLVLADITATRYYHYTPTAERDPVLSAQKNQLRAECFSACNGVYARLDLLQEGFEGTIGQGTTNVDIGMELRAGLLEIQRGDKLHLRVGGQGLTLRQLVDTPEGPALAKPLWERPVHMPDRWVRALGNAAEIHRGMQPVFTVQGPAAQAFIAGLPGPTGKNMTGWLAYSNHRLHFSPRPVKGGAYVPGLHRLSALKRVMTNLAALTFYMPPGPPGPALVVAHLPGARLTLGLTAQAWQGYSGEGALLEGLAQKQVLEDAQAIAAGLAFDAAVDEGQAAALCDLNSRRTAAALALLAVSGKLGYDVHQGAYFHRQLPEDPDRVEKDNPRLTAARKLAHQVEPLGENLWRVGTGQREYRVTYQRETGAKAAACTCTWYLKHQNSRGPCKHILAVQLKEEEV